MVTLTIVFVFISYSVVISLIDMFMYKSPFWTSILSIFTQEKGTNEWMTNAAMIIGLFYSLVVDYRLKKNKTVSKGHQNE